MPERPSEADPLGVDPTTMRRLAEQTLDVLLRQLRDTGSVPVVRSATPSELERRLGGPPPETGQAYDLILKDVEDHVLTTMVRGDHPGYLAFIPGEGTWPGALADFIASALNLYGGSWKEGAGPAELEAIVLEWFKHWIGYPTSAAGTLVSGGSTANLMALATARENLAGPASRDLVVYLTDQAHSSMARAARVVGFARDQVRTIEVDDAYRMRPDALRAAIRADRASGKRPLFVGAAAGTTNTGAIDPLPELAAICAEERVWLHIDAAYGAFAVLTDRGKIWLRGMELADSVTLDPHKWLYQPYECGCLLVRDGEQLRRAFAIGADYLQDVRSGGEAPNFSDLGIQLTRSTRALKVWMSIRYFGLAAFRRAIDNSIDLALHAQRRIAENPSSFELLSRTSLSVVCFRRRFADTDDEAEVERRNRALLKKLEDSGEVWISSTRLRGRYALRICVLNHNTTQREIDRAIDLLET